MTDPAAGDARRQFQCEGDTMFQTTIPRAAGYAVFLLPLGLAQVLGGQTTDTGQLLVFLRQGYSQGMSLLDNCRITMQSELWRDPDWLGFHHVDPQRGLVQTRSEYIGIGARERLSQVELGPDHQPVGGNDFLVYDGSCVLRYLSSPTTLHAGARAGSAFRDFAPDFAGIAAQAQPGGPTDFLTSFPLADILARPDTAVDADPVSLEGLSCYLIRANLEINRVPYKVSCWLSSERSCLPVKLELQEPDGTLVRRVQVVKFSQLPNGGWFPSEVVRDQFTRNSAGAPWHTVTDKFTFTGIELNPQVDEEKVFDTTPDALPVGALLQDHTVGLEYVIGEGPVSDERIRNIIDRVLKDSAVAGPEGSGSPGAPPPDAASARRAPRPLLSQAGAIGRQGARRQGAARRPLALALVACALLIGVVTGVTMCARWRVRRGND
jgi:hypothetical protein